MLAVLRHIGRRRCPALPSARHLSANTVASSKNESNELFNLLSEQADNTNNIISSARTSTQKWHSFEPNRFVKPHQFTYNSRLIAPPKYRTRRPAVAPPAAVSRYHDVFHQFDIDPLSLVMNREILSSFVSEMGKIYPRDITGLTSKSQRRLSKAIRRAKMMGIIPVLSKAPDLITSYIPRPVRYSRS